MAASCASSPVASSGRVRAIARERIERRAREEAWRSVVGRASPWRFARPSLALGPHPGASRGPPWRSDLTPALRAALRGARTSPRRFAPPLSLRRGRRRERGRSNWDDGAFVHLFPL